jgi:cell cycle checkpoint protein
LLFLLLCLFFSLPACAAPQMDAFEAWLSRARTMAPLSLAVAPPHRRPDMPPPPPPPNTAAAAATAPRPSAKLLLLEDLPLSFGSGEGARERLLAALTSLAGASRFPSIVCLTDATSSTLSDERSLGARDALACLEDAGAAHIAFNPATRAEVCKALARVAAAEGAPLPAAHAAALAEAARGDIRAAIGALQLRCAGGGRAAGAGAGAGAAAGKKRKAAGGGAANGGAASGAGAATWARDDTLSLFHALGKLLYNKRTAPDAAAAGSAHAQQQRGASFRFPLAPQHARAPAEVADPEAVLAAAALAPSAALGFLHGAPPRAPFASIHSLLIVLHHRSHSHATCAFVRLFLFCFSWRRECVGFH